MPLPEPAGRFLVTESELRAAFPSQGKTRIIRHRGRCGLNTERLRATIPLAPHTLGLPQGSVSLWVMALEDLSVAAQHPGHAGKIKHSHIYPILSDAAEAQFEVERPSFLMALESHWHPQFWVQWGRGLFYQMYQTDPPRACMSLSHFHMRSLRWYQFVLTWNESANDYRLYANGVLAGTSDRNAPRLTREAPHAQVHVGHPVYAHSDICFYDQALSAEQAADLYRRDCRESDPELEAELRDIYQGSERPFQFSPGAGWTERFNVGCRSAGDLGAFDIQGVQEAPKISRDGLRITTPAAYYRHAKHPELPQGRHVYLFTRQSFEGNLYLEYEFKILRPGGLSLLMTQCSGMQREDVFSEFERSGTDEMSYLFGGHLRNYHWEYYRDMNDVRNDVASHVLVKNPFFRPLGYACRPRMLEMETWHRLQFLQEGSRIRCAMNGDAVVDAADTGFDNSGPVFNCGKAAIRCMINTDIVVRGIRIWDRSQFETLPGSG